MRGKISKAEGEFENIIEVIEGWGSEIYVATAEMKMEEILDRRAYCYKRGHGHQTDS